MCPWVIDPDLGHFDFVKDLGKGVSTRQDSTFLCDTLSWSPNNAPATALPVFGQSRVSSAFVLEGTQEHYLEGGNTCCSQPWV